MPEKRINCIVLVVAIVAVITGFITSSEPKVPNFLHAASMGIVVSAIFYFMVVWVPAYRQKHRIRRYLQKQYDAFKSACILEFLIASQSQNYPHEAQKELLQQDEFRRYFNTHITHDQTRWHAVMNKLNDNNCGTLKEILNHLEILREEILYVLNHIDIHSDEVFTFLKQLSHVILCTKDVEPEYEDIKSFGGLLWEIFAGWNVIEGYRRDDIVQSMIEQI